ncbi:MAG: hypothetical protein IJ575_01805 [Selenomonadaceae bacterium]|nr:hypothetical protein [Selenomonadaceae bacterium]
MAIYLITSDEKNSKLFITMHKKIINPTAIVSPVDPTLNNLIPCFFFGKKIGTFPHKRDV